MELERMGKRSSEKLLAGVEASKERGLSRLLNALSIHHVGARVASILAEHFGNMEALEKATPEELTEVNEIGEIIAKSVYEFVHSAEGQKIIGDLRGAGIKMDADRTKPKPAASAALTGKTLVVTGKLQKYSREQMEDLITQHGGRAASSVSKKTDFLIAGDDAGSKLEKAKELGVKVISETDFECLIGIAP
jgi:DNA ligase (NAD+)